MHASAARIAICALTLLSAIVGCGQSTPAPKPATAVAAEEKIEPKAVPKVEPKIEAKVAKEAGRLVFAFDGSVDARGVPAPWRLMVSTGKAEVAVQPRKDVPGEPALSVRAVGASFFLVRTDRPFELDERTTIAWSWKATALPTGGDIRKSSLLPFADNRNDQVLQLLVTFGDDKVISYVWDTTAPAGTEVREQNPFANIMAVVVESGPANLGAWRSYRRTLADDHRRLFGSVPRAVKAVAVQTNANHTRSNAEGLFGRITFQGTK
jgi:Protein of unknown function (DUF3047)